MAGIVLIGLIALAVWKVYQTMRDKKEWENFEREMKQSRWTKVGMGNYTVALQRAIFALAMFAQLKVLLIAILNNKPFTIAA